MRGRLATYGPGYLKLRSFTRRGADRDLARVLLHDARRHGQTQSGAVLVLLGGEERIENPGQHIRRDAAMAGGGARAAGARRTAAPGGARLSRSGPGPRG